MRKEHSLMPNKVRSGLNSGLDVLECIALSKNPLTLTETAEAVGMSKSSVHEVLATLERRGFVKRLDQRYVVGIKAWEIGCIAAPFEIGRVAGPHVAQLVRDVVDGASLGVLDGTEMVCVHLADSPRAVRVHNNVGDRTPAHCISSGLAFLSCLDDEEICRLFPEKLEKATESTIGDRATLLKELKRVRARGYAVCRGAWRMDVSGISVPVRGPHNKVVAAVCIAAPSYRVTDTWIARAKAPLLATAAQIERELGVTDPIAAGEVASRNRSSDTARKRASRR